MFLMFKKMIAGELSMGETFWKFGVLFLMVLTFVAKVFEKLFYRYSGGYDLISFFKYSFKIMGGNNTPVFWALCYAASLVGILYYAINYMGGIWRSSAKYERSSFLKVMVRLFSFLLLVVCFRILL